MVEPIRLERDERAVANEDIQVVPRRRFELVSESTYRFWTIELNDTTLTVTYGDIGGKVQLRKKECGSVRSAKRLYVRRVREKVRGGYKEVIKKPVRQKTNEDVWAELEDHEPFLAGILAAPDDPTGYAIYADWLDDLGDPRADLIRIQLALHNRRLPMHERARLQRDQDNILSRHARVWLGPLIKFGVWHYDYGQLANLSGALTPYNGLVLSTSPHCRFLRKLHIPVVQEISPSATAEELELGTDINGGMRRLAEADFSNLRSFEYYSAFIANGPQVYLADTIARMPRLESLSLGVSLPGRELAALTLPNLESLTYASTIPVACVREIAQASFAKNVRYLDLAAAISDSDLKSLLSTPLFTGLDDLRLKGDSLSAHGVELCREAVPQFSNQ